MAVHRFLQITRTDRIQPVGRQTTLSPTGASSANRSTFRCTNNEEPSRFNCE